MPAKRSTSLKKVNTRQRTYVREDGSFDQRPVTMWLDSTGTPQFVFEVQAWIVEALGVPDTLRASTADAAERGFDDLQRRFEKWKREVIAEPVIMVYGKYYARDEYGRRIEMDHPFPSNDRDRQVLVGLAYRLAFRVNGHLHSARVETTYVNAAGERCSHFDDEAQVRETRTPGLRLGNSIGDAKVLPYTAELHAKIDGICEAINRAAQALHGILEAPDLAQALLSMGGGSMLSAPTTTPQE